MEPVTTAPLHASARLSQEAWERFIQTGFLACDAGLHSMATELFSNLARLRPDLPQLGIYQAMALLKCGHAEEARDLLAALRRKFPQSQFAKAVFAVSRLPDEPQESVRLFEEVLADGSERVAVDWARLFIDQARRDARPVRTNALPTEGVEFLRHYNQRR
jgi:predicted Zn-dependent protease